MVAFPDDYMTLVPKLLVETMGVLGSSFVSRLNLATGDAVPETKALAKGQIFLLSLVLYPECLGLLASMVVLLYHQHALLDSTKRISFLLL